ncbi:hypothetical protein BSR28_01725 [Boudabousia liubingyangii]|uniref:glycosyltransferase n=1 Tax=Boudabousia liubingyangii TaxID=1921764 RepID=UPI00093F338F|nr:glycosyltransferase [Boudabousia liubingyangii]OKL48447.1 hypothetical protein BSR28_01725 [Boudabousia liubingyangii]
MTKKGLLVFTDSFPFGIGEEFFEQEVWKYEDVFDKIVIISQRTNLDSPQTRKIPANAVARKLEPVSNDGWLKRVLLNFPTIIGREKFISPRRWKSPANAVQDIKFAAKLLEMRKRLPLVLKAEDFEDCDEVVIYSYWFFTGVGLADAVKNHLLKDKKVTIVSRAHAYDVDEKDAPFNFIPARPYLLSKADIVFPISNYAQAFLDSVKVEPKAQIEVARLGVPENTPKVRAQTSPFRIVSCSHLAPYKRVDLLLESVAELEKLGVPVRWTHIGESNPELLDAIKTKASELLSPETYEFLGYVPNEKVRKFYEQSEISLFVNVSNSEGVPVSIMEALSAGIPVLATDAGGTKELVQEGRNGWVIPVDISPVEIAKKLQEIAALPTSEIEQKSEMALTVWDEMANAQKAYGTMVNRLINL